MVKGIAKFIGEVVAELMQVRWPARRDVVIYTLVVLFTVCVAAASLGVMDVVFSQAVKYLIQL